MSVWGEPDRADGLRWVRILRCICVREPVRSPRVITRVRGQPPATAEDESSTVRPFPAIGAAYSPPRSSARYGVACRSRAARIRRSGRKGDCGIRVEDGRATRFTLRYLAGGALCKDLAPAGAGRAGGRRGAQARVDGCGAVGGRPRSAVVAVPVRSGGGVSGLNPGAPVRARAAFHGRARRRGVSRSTAGRVVCRVRSPGRRCSVRTSRRSTSRTRFRCPRRPRPRRSAPGRCGRPGGCTCARCVRRAGRRRTGRSKTACSRSARG